MSPSSILMGIAAFILIGVAGIYNKIQIAKDGVMSNADAAGFSLTRDQASEKAIAHVMERPWSAFYYSIADNAALIIGVGFVAFIIFLLLMYRQWRMGTLGHRGAP
jgi:thiamine transporter ThiT